MNKIRNFANEHRYYVLALGLCAMSQAYADCSVITDNNGYNTYNCTDNVSQSINIKNDNTTVNLFKESTLSNSIKISNNSNINLNLDGIVTGKKASLILLASDSNIKMSENFNFINTGLDFSYLRGNNNTVTFAKGAKIQSDKMLRFWGENNTVNFDGTFYAIKSNGTPELRFVNASNLKFYFGDNAQLGNANGQEAARMYFISTGKNQSNLNVYFGKGSLTTSFYQGALLFMDDSGTDLKTGTQNSNFEFAGTKIIASSKSILSKKDITDEAKTSAIKMNSVHNSTFTFKPAADGESSYISGTAYGIFLKGTNQSNTFNFDQSIIDGQWASLYVSPQSYKTTVDAKNSIFNGDIVFGSNDSNITLMDSTVNGNVLLDWAGTNLSLINNNIISGQVYGGQANTLNVISTTDSILTSNINNFATINKLGSAKYQINSALKDAVVKDGTGQDKIIPLNININEGELVLNSQDNKYSGNTNINGTLTPNQNNTLSSNSVHNIYAQGKLNLAGHSQEISELNNSGTVSFNAQKTPTTLTINNNYSGTKGSQILFNGTGLETLALQGNAKGQTKLFFTENNSQSNTLLEGKKLVTSTIDQDLKTIFSTDQYLPGGAYEYNLYQKDNSLFLSAYQNGMPVFRVDSANYLANNMLGNNLFDFSLLGQHSKQKGTLWIDQKHKNTDFYSGNSQIKTSADTDRTQLGGDIVTWNDQKNQLNIGLTAGEGTAKSSSFSELTGKETSSKVHGYNAGIYATLSPENIEGLSGYGLLGYRWLDNTAYNTTGKTTYDSNGLEGILNTAYTFKVGHSSNNLVNYYVQPNAEFDYKQLRTKGMVDEYNTSISLHDNSHISSQVGLQGFLTYTYGNLDLQPYVGVKYKYTPDRYTVNLDDDKSSISGTKSTVRYSVGVEGKISDQFVIGGDLSKEYGKSDYQDSTASLNLKYLF